MNQLTINTYHAIEMIIMVGRYTYHAKGIIIMVSRYTYHARGMIIMVGRYTYHARGMIKMVGWYTYHARGIIKMVGRYTYHARGMSKRVGRAMASWRYLQSLMRYAHPANAMVPKAHGKAIHTPTVALCFGSNISVTFVEENYISILHHYKLD